MLIGIDGNEANVEKKVGVSWYTFHLLKEMKELRIKNLELRVFLKDEPRSDLPQETSNFKYIVVPKRTLWSQIDLPLALHTQQRDLKVFISPAHYIPRYAPCPTVVVIHDLSYFYYPQDFLKGDLYQLKNWTQYSVKKAIKIVAVSEMTKNDLITNYGVAKEKIEVVYNGFSRDGIKVIMPGFKLNKPYLLYIGILQPRKNLSALILAFAQILKTNPDLYLYIVGKKGWLFEDIYKLVKSRKLVHKVIFTDYLSEENKLALLKQAQAIILPGFYEGFGMPILEAFSAETPVICANTGALPETAGIAALYFDPNNYQELAEQINKLLTDQTLKKKLIQKGQERLSQFSWFKTAAQIIKICKNIK